MSSTIICYDSAGDDDGDDEVRAGGRRRRRRGDKENRQRPDRGTSSAGTKAAAATTTAVADTDIATPTATNSKYRNVSTGKRRAKSATAKKNRPPAQAAADAAVRQYLGAIRRLNGKTRSGSEEDLAPSIVKASVSFATAASSTSGRGRRGSADDGVILLEQHAPRIISDCRKRIKQATECAGSNRNNEADSDSDDVSQRGLDCLCVGIHGIRAVASSTTLFDDGATKQLEAAIKLLYHAVTAAEQLFSQTVATNAKQQRRRRATNAAASRYAFAAYETLGRLLGSYSIPLSTNEGRRTVRFPARSEGVERNTGTLDGSFAFSDESDDPACFDKFPVPRVVDTQTDDSSSAGTLTPEQLASIGIVSTLSISRIVSKKIVAADDGDTAGIDGVDDDCYGFESEMMKLDNETWIRLLVFLLQRTLSDWLSFLGSNSSKDCTKDVLSHCKQSYSILWDVAGRLESSNAKAKCGSATGAHLMIRREAVLTLLCAGRQVDTGPRLPKHLQEAVRDLYFENACSCAWKSSVLFTQQTKRSDGSMSSASLTRFHDDVGSLLDSLATDEESFSYVEYCAYRVLHCGVARKANTETGCSETCMFQHCPFPYAHVAPCNRERSSGHTAFLALFYTCTVLKGELGANSVETTSASTFLINAERIISAFRSVVLDGGDESCAAHHQRYLKLIWLVSLHRIVFEVVESTPHTRNKQNVLATTANILASCVAPLAFATLNQSDTKKQNQLWETIGECYIRAVSAYESLAIANGEAVDEQICRSNVFMEAFVGIYNRTGKHLSPPSDGVEKAAKVSFRSFTVTFVF